MKIFCTPFRPHLGEQMVFAGQLPPNVRRMTEFESRIDTVTDLSKSVKASTIVVSANQRRPAGICFWITLANQLTDISPMAIKYLFGIIDAVTPAHPPGSFEILLDSKRIQLPRTHPKYRTFRSVIFRSYGAKVPIVLVVDSGDLKGVFSPFELTCDSISPVQKTKKPFHFVTFRESPRRHKLFLAHERYSDSFKLLEDSLAEKTSIWVAHSNNIKSEIVFATSRETGRTGVSPAMHFNQPDQQFREITEWYCRQLFRKIAKNESCSIHRLSFEYVEEGCTWRAHEMCRLLKLEDLDPVKVWAFGMNPRLNPRTPNHPKCEVLWSFHVAPALRTKMGLRILDPTLFDQPVSLAEWSRQLNSCDLKTLFTSMHVLVVTENFRVFQADPDYSKTHQGLVILRNNFDLFKAKHGSPPYKKCNKKNS